MRRKIYSRGFVANFPDKLISSTDLEFRRTDFNENWARYKIYAYLGENGGHFDYRIPHSIGLAIINASLNSFGNIEYVATLGDKPYKEKGSTYFDYLSGGKLNPTHLVKFRFDNKYSSVQDIVNTLYLFLRDGIRNSRNTRNESLTESLKSSTLSEIENLIDTDEEINELFLTPVNELPVGYRHLSPGFGNRTLYDILLQYENAFNCRYILQYKDNKPAGLVFYIVNDNKVEEIDMFSFDLNSNNTEMLLDLRRLLNQLLDQYESVSFAGNKNTEINNIYKRIVSKYPKHKEIDFKGLGITKYTIYK